MQLRTRAASRVTACIADAAACEAMHASYAEPNLPATCINLRPAHVLKDLQGGLPVALVGVGGDQGVVGHTAGLQACLVHVIKHILDLHGGEHPSQVLCRITLFFLMLVGVVKRHRWPTAGKVLQAGKHKC